MKHDSRPSNRLLWAAGVAVIAVIGCCKNDDPAPAASAKAPASAVPAPTGMVAGAKCKPEGASACIGKHSGLHCRNGVWQPWYCRGPKGCRLVDNIAKCDDSIASKGDLCPLALENNKTCDVSRKDALVCKDGKFQTFLHCTGPEGCSHTKNGLACDNTLARVGDPCVAAQDACSADTLDRALRCQDGKFVFDHYCRGKNGCRTENRAPFCDGSIAQIGDPCRANANGTRSYACSVDGSASLFCKNGVMALHKRCPVGCTLKRPKSGAVIVSCK